MNDSLLQNMPQDNPAYTKRCPTCKLWLPFSSFDLSRQTIDGLYGYCKKCRSEYAKNSLTPEQKRDRNYRVNYGITAKQYDRMFEEQNGVCACCGQPETQRSQGRDARNHPERIAPLAVDHDHKTGDVRALLCCACNQALGRMQEDPERIQKLKEYAEWCCTREPNAKILQLKLVD